MRECGEDLLVDISEILFNELAFFRLMQDLDTAGSKLRQEAGGLGEDEEEEEEEEGEEEEGEEEGATGTETGTETGTAAEEGSDDEGRSILCLAYLAPSVKEVSTKLVGGSYPTNLK